MATDIGLTTLLDLNDSSIAQERGCWVKIEAWEVPKSDEMPHGIRYSLTLHDSMAVGSSATTTPTPRNRRRRASPADASNTIIGTGTPGTRAFPTHSRALISCWPISFARSTRF